MPTNVTLNGTSYAIPATGEGGWGTAVTNYLIALSSGVLQKAGGSFTLTAETDFGATYGLKSVYFKSRNTPATAGIFRLGNAEAVSWRNAANSADLDLKVNSSDILEFGGNPITTLALGSAHEVLTMNAGATAEYAKLDNDNIAAAAAIDAAKIADASVSNTEFQYLNGVTSSIQTQFGAKLDDVATANDNEIPRFNTNGQALQNSGVTIDDSNNMAGIANVIISGAIDAASASNLDIGGTTATTINIGRSGQTTVIKGDLQVEGTTTTVDSTVLDVADKNITINKGGNQATADGGGFTLEMSDATDVAMVYLSSLASRFKIGDVGSETEVMSVGAIQVITAQKAFDTQVWLKEITTPTTPDSGYRALYPKSDGKLYTLNDAGEEIAVGSGSGQGEINYITNSDAETNTSDWTATGSATIVRTNTAGELLRGTYSFKLASTGAGTIYTDFTIPEADENKKLKIEHDLKEISGYAAGEWTLKIIKDPAGTATDITPATTDIPGGQGQFLTTFDCTDADTYRLIYTCTGATNGVTIDNVIVGPGKVVQGAIVGPWTSFTTTLTGFGNGTYSLAYKRSGDKIKIQGALKVGSTAPTAAIWFTLPENLTADYSLNTIGVAGTDAYQRVGLATAYMSEYATAAITRENTHTSRFQINGAGGSYVSGSGADWGITAAGITLANGDVLTIDMEVPIAEWAGSGTLNVGTNDVEYAYNTTAGTGDDTSSFGYGQGGYAIGSVTNDVDGDKRRVRFQSVKQPGDKLAIEFSEDQVTWIEAGSRINSIYMIENLKYDGTNYSGVGFEHDNAMSDTDIDVRFGRYRNGGSADWTGVSALYWRVKKTKSGAAIGFGAATATQSGLTKMDANAATNNVGEYESGTYTATITNIANVAADAHVYASYMKVGNRVQVNGTVNIDPTTATTFTDFRISLPIATTSTDYVFVSGASTVSSITYHWGRVSQVAVGGVRLSGEPGSAANQTVGYSFMYTIE